MLPKRIHIIGSIGSGKTTLARKLSAQLQIPCFELDNVVWERRETEDIKRTEEERNEYLDKIIDAREWIVEGVHHTWVSSSFQKADIILFWTPELRSGDTGSSKDSCCRKSGSKKRITGRL